MLRDLLAFLWDMKDSALAIQEFTAGKGFDEYVGDRQLRAAVERQFGIIGEALNQLSRIDPEVAASIPRGAEIVALRNVIIHGYAIIKHEEIWRIIERDLPPLLEVVEGLIEDLSPDARASDLADEP